MTGPGGNATIEPGQGRARLTLVLIAIAFFGPLVLALFLYTTNAWRPGASIEHGKLLTRAPPLPDLPLPPPLGASGKPVTRLRGHWSLIYFGPGGCRDTCAERVRAGRQIRLALGKEMTRVQRVFCVTDGAAPSAELVEGNQGLVIVTDVASSLVIGRTLGQRADGDIFLADPLGNPVLRFPADTAMSDVLKDLQHLLRNSEIG
jgi:hypothetical protein